MNKKIIIISIVVLLAIVFGVYQGFFRKEKPELTLVEVLRGNVFEQISETGHIQKGEEINLNFKTTGRIEKIYIEVGRQVKTGQILARQETGLLEIQLEQVKAALTFTEVEFEKLLAGASPEKIQIAETAVSNAQINLTTAERNLINIKAQAKGNLEAAHQDSLAVLKSSYIQIDNAFSLADLIQRTYFTLNDQESIRVRENKARIGDAKKRTSAYIEIAKKESKQEDINLALSETEKVLNIISDALVNIRDICQNPVYRHIVSLADKASLDAHRTNINNSLTNTINSRQAIFLTELTNDSKINSAKANVSSFQGLLKITQDELALLIAPVRQKDIDLYQARINQARAQVRLLEEQIQETVLYSPFDGEITRVNKRVGEIAQPIMAESVISLIPIIPFQIKVDIYEEDVIKMKVGNPVDISLVVFPGQVFKGKVVSIDPTEKLIGGVVYYETTIGFTEEPPKELKPGMTADLIIKTAFREDVLIIPEEAIQEKNNEFIVQVLKDGLTQDRVIEIGLKGDDNIVEVISGLDKGEKVIIR